MLTLSTHNWKFHVEFAKCVCDVLDYISNENIKTIRDQVTTQSIIQDSNFVLLNSVNSLLFQF